GSPMGGGGRDGGAAPPDGPDEPAEPMEPTPERDAVGEDTVAPRNQPQSDLVLRTIRDLLENQADTSDLEEATGMSRSEIEQFVKQFERVESGPAGPGRDIEVQPGESGEDAR